MTKLNFNIDGITVEYIDSQENLLSIIGELQSSNALAVDTEFDKNRHSYGFNICLIQIFNGKKAYLIDPLKIKTENLSNIWKIFENPEIQKVFHSCKEDIELLKSYNCLPKNVFDTELATKILNYEKTSLKNVISHFFAKSLDKSAQATNWNKRPLSDKQLNYAAIDVIYLLNLKEILEKQLIEKDRIDWLEEEMNFILENSLNSREDSIKKLCRKYHLRGFEAYLFGEIYKFREKIASELNKPPYQIFDNYRILEITYDPFYFIDNWQDIRGIIYKIKNKSFSDKLESLVQKAQSKYTNQSKKTDEKKVYKDSISRKNKDYILEKFFEIRESLEKKYGKYTTELIINKRKIEKFLNESDFQKYFRDYSYNIIKEEANALNIDWSEIERILRKS